jgi:hypothetical protein
VVATGAAAVFVLGAVADENAEAEPVSEAVNVGSALADDHADPLLAPIPVAVARAEPDGIGCAAHQSGLAIAMRYRHVGPSTTVRDDDVALHVIVTSRRDTVRQRS